MVQSSHCYNFRQICSSVSLLSLVNAAPCEGCATQFSVSSYFTYRESAIKISRMHLFSQKKEHLVFNIWVSYRLGHPLKLLVGWQPFYTSWGISALIEIVVCRPFSFSLTFASGWYSIQEESQTSEIPRMTTKFKARQNSVVLWGSLEQRSQFYCYSTLLHLS